MIEKTIIANYGNPDLGKTKSIVLAYERVKNVADNHVLLHTDMDDICALLEINGVKVGICSQGDPWSNQQAWLDELILTHQCTIILAACHHSGATAERIEDDAAKYNYRLFWTSNARIYKADTTLSIGPKGMRSRFNKQWAEEIANLIESWCYA